MIIAQAKRVSVAISQALAPRGASSSFDIGIDYPNVLTIPWELKAPFDTNTGMFKLFSHIVYYLFDPYSPLYYVTPYMTMHLSFLS